MADRLITIARIGNPLDAHFAEQVLIEAGVRSSLTNLNLLETANYLGNAVGDIPIEVLEGDVIEAVKLLEEHGIETCVTTNADGTLVECNDDPELTELEIVSHRAFVAAILGTIMLPPLGHLYSSYLLFRSREWRDDMRDLYLRERWFAFVLNCIFIALAVFLLLFLLPSPR